MRKSLLSRAMVSALALCAVLATALLVLAAPALAAEPVPCPNEQLRGESLENPVTKAAYSAQLPDCRAYELVSSPDTRDEPAINVNPIYKLSEGEGIVGPQPGSALITPGGAVFYRSEALPAETSAVPNGRVSSVFTSARGSTGWGITDLTPFGPLGRAAGEYELLAASADGSKALVTTTEALVPEDRDQLNLNGSNYAPYDLYVVSVARGPVLVSHGALERGYAGYGDPNVCLPLTTISVNNCAPPSRGLTFDTGLTAVGFRSSAVLDPGGLPPPTYRGRGQCYTWSAGGAHIATFTDFRSTGSSGEDECEQVGMLPDGRPVFLDMNSDAYQGRLFVGGGGSEFPGGVTQISGDTPDAASFDAATSDGKTVYVTTTDHLVLANTDTGGDIYAVHLPEAPSGATPPTSVSCVSCGVNGGGAGATFVGQSADGSHVFFSTAEGLWSWDARGALATKLTSGTAYSEVAFSQNGQYVVIVTTEALGGEGLSGTSHIYELADGAAPELVTSVTGADGYSAPVVSNDGRRVVYDDSPAGGAPGVVEEWTGGQTRQISPLGAQFSSRLLGTAGEGLQDVFFLVNEPLVTQDLNAGTTNIYDARTGGGFPASIPPPPNLNQTPNPTDLPSSSYPVNLTSSGVQPPPLGADSSQPAGVSRPKALTDAQKLSKALKACKSKLRKKRATCEKRARERYGETTRNKVKAKTRGSR